MKEEQTDKIDDDAKKDADQVEFYDQQVKK